MTFGRHALDIDPAAETERIVSMLRSTIGTAMRRRGAATIPRRTGRTAVKRVGRRTARKRFYLRGAPRIPIFGSKTAAPDADFTGRQGAARDGGDECGG